MDAPRRPVADGRADLLAELTGRRVVLRRAGGVLRVLPVRHHALGMPERGVGDRRRGASGETSASGKPTSL